MQTVVLLTISNIFMTFAWYGQSQIHSPTLADRHHVSCSS